MDERVAALLSGANFAQFGTVNSDGSPHIDTVWFSHEWGMIAIATTMATKKAKNIEEKPAGYLVVTNRSNPYEQAQIKVGLDRIEADDSLEICDSISKRYTGKPFPQRKHKGRIVIYLKVASCKYHIARV
jgi:general stress protein 26